MFNCSRIFDLSNNLELMPLAIFIMQMNKLKHLSQLNCPALRIWTHKLFSNLSFLAKLLCERVQSGCRSERYFLSNTKSTSGYKGSWWYLCLNWLEFFITAWKCASGHVLWLVPVIPALKGLTWEDCKDKLACATWQAPISTKPSSKYAHEQK